MYPRFMFKEQRSKPLCHVRSSGRSRGVVAGCTRVDRRFASKSIYIVVRIVFVADRVGRTELMPRQILPTVRLDPQVLYLSILCFCGAFYLQLSVRSEEILIVAEPHGRSRSTERGEGGGSKVDKKPVNSVWKVAMILLFRSHKSGYTRYSQPEKAVFFRIARGNVFIYLSPWILRGGFFCFCFSGFYHI